jgi:hypothetical protein
MEETKREKNKLSNIVSKHKNTVNISPDAGKNIFVRH